MLLGVWTVIILCARDFSDVSRGVHASDYGVHSSCDTYTVRHKKGTNFLLCVSFFRAGQKLVNFFHIH